jgi:hypothetical protein
VPRSVSKLGFSQATAACVPPTRSRHALQPRTPREASGKATLFHYLVADNKRSVSPHSTCNAVHWWLKQLNYTEASSAKSVGDGHSAHSNLPCAAA